MTIVPINLQFLKGVGPKRAQVLERLGLKTVEDLLFYFPRDWQDRRETKDLSLPTASGLVVARGRVVRAGVIPAGRSLALFRATLATGDAKLSAVWFKHLNRRFDVFTSLKKDIAPGSDVWLVGRAEPTLVGVREIHVDEHYRLDDERSALHVDRLTPLYPLTEGVSQRLLRELVFQALGEATGRTREALPPALLARRGLLALPQALKGVHFPGSQAELEAARCRLAYDELLLLELAWLLKRRQTQSLRKGFAYEIKRDLLTPFRERLGFELTAAQKRVINEIFEDLRRPYPMTRLLQGDVGSGKTVVALSALLLAVENGHQGAFMAPTEILAEQHFATVSKFLGGLPVRAELLTSGAPPKRREQILERVRRGEVDLVVGTHALLEEDVQFPNLKLVVIDEQHRFGVRQRSTLRQKASVLDLLIMTATPIPRTLALALYGDLDVSTLDQMPPGKVTAQTFAADEKTALDALKAEVARGRQAYVVYPIIEESSRLDLQSAKAEFERLKKGELAGLRVALIHGALPAKQKAAAMRDFAQGKTQVLVATPVIEVGIDVPNATVMVIQNVERFGLASLHQLRGRIGRGALASSCYLVGKPRTPQAQARIDTLVGSSDGFRIGEEDLKLRGPGEFLGTAQHGALALKIADVVKDAAILAWARADAEGLLALDPRLLSPENAALRARLIALYQDHWNWIDLA